VVVHPVEISAKARMKGDKLYVLFRYLRIGLYDGLKYLRYSIEL